MPSGSGADEDAIARLLGRHDECWARLDFEGLGALWDADEEAPVYVGEEYAAPVVGWGDLHRHWARLAGRLRRARVFSTLRLVKRIGPETALAVVEVDWEFLGRGSEVTHAGRNWVTAVLRDGATGWRFVHWAESPA